MHSFSLPEVTEDSSKILKQDVAPLQRRHEKHHCRSCSSLFSLSFSCVGMSWTLYHLSCSWSFKNELYFSSCNPPSSFWEELLCQFLSLPANLLSFNIFPLLTNVPTVGKHSHHSLPCTWQFLPLN